MKKNKSTLTWNLARRMFNLGDDWVQMKEYRSAYYGI